MPQKKDAGEKKSQILTALHQCLQEKPFHQTSIRDIARKAGVNHGLLHYYFKSKEDILIQYIEYVITHYKAMFTGWREETQQRHISGKDLIEAFFTFMNERITLDAGLSKVFIEIWEIAAYTPEIRERLQKAYGEWMDALSQMLNPFLGDPKAARRMSAASVAFLEGMALFSILLDPDAFDFREVLTGFQKKIIESL